MTPIMLRASLVAVGLVLVACGDDTTGGGAGGSGTGGGAAASTGDGATTGATGGGGDGSGGDDAAGGAGGGSVDDRQTLLSTDWSLEPGTEIYLCQRLTVDEDIWVSEFHPLIPGGTHHTVVTLVDGGDVPDGTRECTNPFEGGWNQIYGTGVGSEPLIMPPGVAVKIPAGKQIVLNLHLFNAGAEAIEGTSGIAYVAADPAEVVHEADSELWGKLDFSIPPSGTTTEHASCVVQSDVSVFSILPHMHQLGRHLKLTHTPAGGEETVLFDEDYDFDSQVNRSLSPAVEIAAGDTVSIACTWDNPTSETIGFGESTTDEMCFAGLWMYPADQVFCAF